MVCSLNLMDDYLDPTFVSSVSEYTHEDYRISKVRAEKICLVIVEGVSIPGVIIGCHPTMNCRQWRIIHVQGEYHSLNLFIDFFTKYIQIAQIELPLPSV
jgi:hypothetical protein